MSSLGRLRRSYRDIRSLLLEGKVVATNLGHNAHAQLRDDSGGLVVEDDAELYVDDVRPPTPA